MTKTRITFYLSEAMVDKAKNAVFWTPGMTLSGLVEQALEERVERMESERGQAFPERSSELAKGRPAR
ncbi:MAG: hypothetical protein H0S85_14340 [Desulfovibrionaceae bacterium]|nr:hypothetical protein [Desulfovibrionaceae bacterium]